MSLYELRLHVQQIVVARFSRDTSRGEAVALFSKATDLARKQCAPFLVPVVAVVVSVAVAVVTVVVVFVNIFRRTGKK